MKEIGVEGRPPARSFLATEWKWVISIGAAMLIPTAIVLCIVLKVETVVLSNAYAMPTRLKLVRPRA